MVACVHRKTSRILRVSFCACWTAFRTLLALCPTVMASAALAIPGQPGTLDATFATSSSIGAGRLVLPVGASNDQATAMVLQPDGKSVLAGGCSNGTNNDFCAVRLNPDGTLDTTFGVAGKLTLSMVTGDDQANALALQPDGKLVLAGSCFNGTFYDFCAARLNPDGGLDTTFNSSGKVTLRVGSRDDKATALLLQSDGKLVLTGYCRAVTYDFFCAARLNADGTFDTAFANMGKFFQQVGTNTGQANAAALQADGKLVLAGYCFDGSQNVFCTIRLNADGSFDTAFNANGKLVLSAIGSFDLANAIALQLDGKLVLAGFCTNRACAIRLNADGGLDTSFNGTGKLVVPQIGSCCDRANAVAIQPDGKLVLAGYCLGSGSAYNFCAVRLNSDASLDATFNGTGKFILQLDPAHSDDRAFGLTLQPDGKPVFAGYCHNGTNYDFCAIRLDGGPFAAQQCRMDIDGDGKVLATTDMLIGMRIALGMRSDAVINGINFPVGATRTSWTAIRTYLVTQCGMAL